MHGTPESSAGGVVEDQHHIMEAAWQAIVQLAHLRPRDRGALRRTCRRLKALVDDGMRELDARGLDGLCLPPSLAAAWPRLTHFSSRPEARLNSLAGFGPFLRALVVNYNGGVRDLSPLVACMALTRLECRLTGVADLAPLPVSVEHLAISCTPVRDLSALSACTALTHLECSYTHVTSLEPLASCRFLEHLNINGVCVLDLSPLSALARLTTLCLAHLFSAHDQGGI